MRIITAILLLLSASSYAQSVSVQSSPEFAKPFPEVFFTEILGQDESGYYFLREIGPETNSKLILEKYSPELNLLFTKDIESSSGVMGNSKHHFQTLLGKDELLVFLSAWNKEKGESGLWVQRLDNQGEKMGEEIELSKEDNARLLNSSEHLMELSPDGSKLAVLVIPPFDKGAKDQLQLKVFKVTDFSLLWEKEIAFEHEMERYPRHDLLVNNSGTAYLFKEVKEGSKEYLYFLITAGEGQMKKEEINLGEDRLNQSRFRINSRGELIGGGMLAELKTFVTNWQKTWMVKAGEEGMVCSRIEPLGPDLLSNLMSEKKAEKEGTKLAYFQLRYLLEQPDGGYLMLTEQQTSSKTALGDASQIGNYRYELTFGDVIALSFNSNCSREWHSYHPKKQKFTTLNSDMHQGSFAYTIAADQFHIIWNYTELSSTITFPKRHWIDKSGSKIAVVDVFGAEAVYPTFLTSFSLQNGKPVYTDRTFNSLPLAEIQQHNSFNMAVDPSVFFNHEGSMVILSRMPGEAPKRMKFSRIGF
jgi:hypothetical protein